MAEDTNIEWADDTVNPWWGCTKVSPACANCYAETLDARFRMGGETHWGPGAPRFIRVEKAIGELERIARRSDKEGRPRRVFIASMADVFEDRPDLVEPRKMLWDALHRLAGDEPRITPLLLTKRPDVMAAWAEEHGWPAGCWAGTTVEDQRRADERIPHLLRVPAGVRFLSMEPLLGDVGLAHWLTRFEVCVNCGGYEETVASDGDACPSCGDRYFDSGITCWGHEQLERELHGSRDPESVIDNGPRIHWVIAGGESGPRARPSHPAWFRSIRDQCEAAGVAFHFKQRGRWTWDRPNPERAGPVYVVRVDGGIVGHPDPGVHKKRVWPVGKRVSGRVLDGRTHDGVPHG